MHGRFLLHERLSKFERKSAQPWKRPGICRFVLSVAVQAAAAAAAFILLECVNSFHPRASQRCPALCRLLQSVTISLVPVLPAVASVSTFLIQAYFGDGMTAESVRAAQATAWCTTHEHRHTDTHRHTQTHTDTHRHTHTHTFSTSRYPLDPPCPSAL